MGTKYDGLVKLECGHEREVFNPVSKVRKQERVSCIECGKMMRVEKHLEEDG